MATMLPSSDFIKAGVYLSIGFSIMSADHDNTFGDHSPVVRLLVGTKITPRQIECLAWVQQGKSASDIGGILGISGRTVEGHLSKLCDHLGVKTRLQAVLKARDLGLFGTDAVPDAPVSLDRRLRDPLKCPSGSLPTA
jgi:DNA-binding CsgD family transcriptional regulator